MKKKIIITATFVLALVIFCTGLVSCNEKLPDEPQKLSTPVVTINSRGVAQWAAVPNAVGYLYVTGGEEKRTDELSVSLADGESIKVKAVGDGKEYLDSDYSAVQIYNAVSHSHTDNDENGLCDYCGDSVVITIDFYAVNDLHGKYLDTSVQPGVDEFTAYMKKLYADDTAYEVLLSSGDMWQGTVESSSNRGKLMTEWMNDVGFVSMTLGNHEYDWGPNGALELLDMANFPFLGINITYNGAAVDYCRPSVVVERGGVKIGIIGAMGDCLSSISGEFSGGLYFATGSELTKLVKDESVRLREQEGCDFIVMSYHDSYSNYDEALSDGYIDLVFEGHTHKSYVHTDGKGIYHVQGGGENRGIGKATLTINSITGERSVKAEVINTKIFNNKDLDKDPVVEEIFNKYFTENPYTDVVGTLNAGKSSDEILDQLAKLYLAFGKKVWGSEYDIVYGGGYMSTRSPYTLPAGKVCYSQIFSLLPFDNQIVLGSISGVNLKSRLIYSSNKNYHGAYDIDVKSIVDSKTYYVIVDTYSSTYAPNKITEIARYDAGVYARTLLRDFIADGGWGSGSGKAKADVPFESCYAVTLSAYFVDKKFYEMAA